MSTEVFLENETVAVFDTKDGALEATGEPVVHVIEFPFEVASGVTYSADTLKFSLEPVYSGNMGSAVVPNANNDVIIPKNLQVKENTITTDMYVNGKLEVVGKVLLKDNLRIKGGLEIDGKTNFKDKLTVLNELTVSDRATVDELQVTHSARVYEKLIVGNGDADSDIILNGYSIGNLLNVAGVKKPYNTTYVAVDPSFETIWNAGSDYIAPQPLTSATVDTLIKIRLQNRGSYPLSIKSNNSSGWLFSNFDGNNKNKQIKWDIFSPLEELTFEKLSGIVLKGVAFAKNLPTIAVKTNNGTIVIAAEALTFIETNDETYKLDGQPYAIVFGEYAESQNYGFTKQSTTPEKPEGVLNYDGSTTLVQAGDIIESISVTVGTGSGDHIFTISSLVVNIKPDEHNNLSIVHLLQKAPRNTLNFDPEQPPSEATLDLGPPPAPPAQVLWGYFTLDSLSTFTDIDSNTTDYTVLTADPNGTLLTSNDYNRITVHNNDKFKLSNGKLNYIQFNTDSTIYNNRTGSSTIVTAGEIWNVGQLSLFETPTKVTDGSITF
jgi:cytoskeletal protein CcmA (bactofilin family)